MQNQNTAPLYLVRRPGERNPIEGKFGQAKSAYVMDRIKARLQQTSESWVATIVMVLNLVKLTWQVPYCLLAKFFTYSAGCLGSVNIQRIRRQRLPVFEKASLTTYSADPN